MRGATRFETYELDRLAVVAAPLELDVTNAEDMGAALIKAATHSPIVIADLTVTEFCDSVAIQVLVNAAKFLARDHRELRVVVTAPEVTRVLGVLGLTDVLAVFPSLIEAVASGFDGAQGIAL
jgi:anti-anti-sigma factor